MFPGLMLFAARGTGVIVIISWAKGPRASDVIVVNAQLLASHLLCNISNSDIAQQAVTNTVFVVRAKRKSFPKHPVMQHPIAPDHVVAHQSPAGCEEQ